MTAAEKIGILETQIRLLVKKERGKPMRSLIKKAKGLINRGLEGESPSLIRRASASLLDFLRRQYDVYAAHQKDFEVYGLLLLLTGHTGTGHPPAASKRRAEERLLDLGVDTSRELGVPLQEYAKQYERRVAGAIDALSGQYPRDKKTRNSLRRMAELEVRDTFNRAQVTSLRERGVRLVICSSHADCSARCRAFQGKVYSLDGTSGKTDDGRAFVPLERATDVYTVTKGGKRWKNGLFGFGCRHYLVPYEKGLSFPSPKKETMEREYTITQKCRSMERKIRQLKIEETEADGLAEPLRAKLAGRRTSLEKKFLAFAKAHARPVDPDRLKIL